MAIIGMYSEQFGWWWSVCVMESIVWIIIIWMCWGEGLASYGLMMFYGQESGNGLWWRALYGDVVLCEGYQLLMLYLLMDLFLACWSYFYCWFLFSVYNTIIIWDNSPAAVQTWTEYRELGCGLLTNVMWCSSLRRRQV